jgi:hypothetical protein
MAGLRVWSNATTVGGAGRARWLLGLDQPNKTSVPPLVYKNKSSYDHL